MLLTSWALASEAPENSAEAIVLIHADTGRVLYGENENSPMLIASTTKIMTALVVLDHCSADEIVEIPEECAGIEGSSMYLKAGERYSVRDLLYGMLLVSGNDAASALAVYCAGSEEAFAALMNIKAAALGLENTSFENPHGLDGEKQYSSAFDLAQITKAALANELFAEIVATQYHTVGEQTLKNHNKLLWDYEGCLGVKTGYTMAAGRTLVSCAERDGLKLICVTLSAPDDWDDHTALYDWAFGEFKYVDPLPLGAVCQLPVISGEQDYVRLEAMSGKKVLVGMDEKLSLTIEAPRFVYAGIVQGQQVGKAIVSVNGETLADFPLVYSESVALAEGIRLTPWERFLKLWFILSTSVTV
jgi:D-alanyl-D-alanine carboxypeptidase